MSFTYKLGCFNSFFFFLLSYISTGAYVDCALFIRDFHCICGRHL